MRIFMNRVKVWSEKIGLCAIVIELRRECLLFCVNLEKRLLELGKLLYVSYYSVVAFSGDRD